MVEQKQKYLYHIPIGHTRKQLCYDSEIQTLTLAVATVYGNTLSLELAQVCVFVL